MKTKEEKVRDAVARLRKINFEVAADNLERAIEDGEITLRPQRSEVEMMIYAALIFSDLDIKFNNDTVYIFETK